MHVRPSLRLRAVVHDEKNPEHTKHLEAFLGRAKYYERTKNFPLAIECLHQVIVFFPWFDLTMFFRFLCLFMFS